MSLPNRLPHIAGAAQSVQRLEDPTTAASPIELMEQALRAAAEDAGNPALLSSVDAVLVPRGTWRYGAPGKLLAERIGAPNAYTVTGGISGHMTQTLIDWACNEIVAGRRDVVAIVGGESEHSKRKLAKTERGVHWDDEIPGEPDMQMGDHDTILPHEMAANLVSAAACFALCETSLRHHRGTDPAAHRRHISEVASRLSDVAAENPSAWIQRRVSAEEIHTPSAANRMVMYPYTKLMTANIAVDQAAALILCSTEAADRLGLRSEGRVYLRAATEMQHARPMSARNQLHDHPGMTMAAKRVLEMGGVESGDLAHVDLYSCFPFAVQVGAEALGLSQERPLTVTGGLTFSGGPFGNYVVQSTARMVEVLREDPGQVGLVGSVGGLFSKFGFGLYSTDPGDGTFKEAEDVGDAFAAAHPERGFHEAYDGPVTTESYTVDVDPGGPRVATFTAIAPDGGRVWGITDDADTMNALLDGKEGCGLPAQMADGKISLD